MKKYIVMSTSFATKENPNFAGQVAISYYGKNQKLIGHVGTHAKATYSELPLENWLIKEYGYNRLCDAKRSWIFKNPENTQFWRSNTEIIEIEF